MKRSILLAAAALLFSFAATTRAQKAEDYPLAVHVYRTGEIDENTTPFICLDVTIEGDKFALESESAAQSKFGRLAMKIGDYKARMLREDWVNPAEYAREYEFLLSDGKKLKFYVIGEMED